MSKVRMHVDVRGIVERIKNELPTIGDKIFIVTEFKTYRGKKAKHGHIMISLKTNLNIGLNVDIDCNRMARDKHYLDEMIPNIYNLLDSALEARKECQAMV